MTKTVVLENTSGPIICNAICLGFVRTPLIETQISMVAKFEGFSENVAAKHLLQEKQTSLQYVEAAGIAKMVSFLCSTGSELGIGYTIAQVLTRIGVSVALID